MKIKKELVKRNIAEDTVLVPVGKTVYESNGLFILNEVGSFIWDQLEEAENEKMLLAAVLEAYDVTEDIARKDIHVFLENLRGMGIIE